MERYVVKAGLDYQEPLVEVRLRSQELTNIIEAFLIMEYTLLIVLIIIVLIAERAFCACFTFLKRRYTKSKVSDWLKPRYCRHVTLHRDKPSIQLNSWVSIHYIFTWVGYPPEDALGSLPFYPCPRLGIYMVLIYELNTKGEIEFPDH
jgi:hypothetical protein